MNELFGFFDYTYTTVLNQHLHLVVFEGNVDANCINGIRNYFHSIFYLNIRFGIFYYKF